MKYKLILLVLCFVWSCRLVDDQTIDLAGEWEFKIDTADQGITEKWYTSKFNGRVQLPGSMVENGKGFDVTLNTKWTGGVKDLAWYDDPNYAPYHSSENIRFPYWLQPLKKYTGAAWYQKKVHIPSGWQQKNLWLHLERVHWESMVWVNGVDIGMQNSLAAAHKYNITPHVKVGENSITIRVDNRIKDIDVGINSHSITDHTQSNWNGIIGDISIFPRDKIYLKNIQVFPHIASNTVDIRSVVQNDTEKAQEIDIGSTAILNKSAEKNKIVYFKFDIPVGETNIAFSYPLQNKVLTWDEFAPNVYQLALTLKYQDGYDEQYIDFGFRDIDSHSEGLTINGRPLFLRGTLECAIFPLTGYPPTDTKGWQEVFDAVHTHGLNHLRFHSWCPPEAAFQVADEMGIYLQVEASSWANQSTTLGSGLPLDQYIYDESERIIQSYGNHPSFVMMAYGNEPGGSGHVQFLQQYLTYWKEKDDRRIYTSGAGWPMIDENDFHSSYSGVRIQGWGEGLNSIINSQPPSSDYDWSAGLEDLRIPMVSHEIGQWCVYPNFKEVKKYSGVLKAKNFELFEESLHAHHMGHLADSFLMASGKLQALCYKADIEAALRTPKLGGFQLLDLHDFPGQGTALVGVLDPFWKDKGYITSREYRRFCNTTVPLARLKKRIFLEGETLMADISVAHFGPSPINGTIPTWKLLEGESQIAKGTLESQDISIGHDQSMGKISYTFERINNPRKLTLEVSVDTFSNTWDIWVYPSTSMQDNHEIKLVTDIDSSTLQFLEAGEKVLLSLGRGRVASSMGGNVGVGFSSIFWNTAWTAGQKPHTLGILCNPNHPALASFPTEYHSNWQWWDAMSHSDAIQLDSFSSELKPIVRIIDDWVSNRRLALVFEAQVGNGSLLVSGVDLMNDLQNRSEAVQLKKSLVGYMATTAFDPKVVLQIDQLQAIVK
ncbi:MAG: beta-galactosidase [Saprospiraceae bacterium]|nr:beta-galactosidase [Saprospiraceae bacterium]